jgi:uncharacterized protein
MTTALDRENLGGLVDGDIPDWLHKLHIIDTDAHYSEPHDLWTRHAPKHLKDRMPHVELIDGREQWVFDGVTISPAISCSVILPDGAKAPGVRIWDLMRDQVHRSSYDWRERIAMLDRIGIWAQILYPNLAGFGNYRFMSVSDAAVRTASSIVYNEAMAEVQEGSRNRLLPMAMLPWWDISASLDELRRVAKLGFRGIAMSSDPQDSGHPDLAQPAWDPLWKACCDLGLSVSFHVGSSDSARKGAWFGDGPWTTLSDERKVIIGTTTLFMSNARILANMIISGILERFPDLKIVSVESGIGWIPFFLEALDYSFADVAKPFLTQKPSEYFRRQVYSCFWFEKIAPTTKSILDAIGVDHIMFETDYPHAVCLYPNMQGHIASVFADVDDTVRRKILQDNAAALYRIDLPKA